MPKKEQKQASFTIIEGKEPVGEDIQSTPTKLNPDKSSNLVQEKSEENSAKTIEYEEHHSPWTSHVTFGIISLFALIASSCEATRITSESQLQIPSYILAAWIQMKLVRSYAHLTRRKPIMSPWEIAGVSLLSFACLPNSGLPLVGTWQDPFYLIWILTMSWFFLRVGPSILAAGKRKTDFKLGVLLAIYANSYILIQSLNPDLMHPNVWWSFQGIAFALLGISIWIQKKNPHKQPEAQKVSIEQSAESVVIPLASRARFGLFDLAKRNLLQRSPFAMMTIWFIFPIVICSYLSWQNSSAHNSMLIQMPDIIKSEGLQSAIDLAKLEKSSTSALAKSDFSPLIFALTGITLSAIGAALSVGYNTIPTHLELGKSGVRLLWRRRFRKAEGKYLNWDSVTQIQKVESKGGAGRIIFLTDTSQNSISIDLSKLSSTEQKKAFLKGIEIFASETKRDAGMIEALNPPQDNSYTELWLQSLTAPPKRERLKPLSPGVELHDARFIIQRLLGAGGQGHAYLAKETSSNVAVVLKEFILPVYVDPEVRRSALENFEKEAKLLKDLSHPQIVHLRDYFVEDHRAYLVLEHVEGQSLQKLVQEEGQLNEDQTINLAEQMIDILSYLHSQSPAVIHRDFTPDNLILQSDGKLKLIDFDVAKQCENNTLGTMVGKHCYMPPEQFRGEARAQSDIYALGASLCFMLTGKEPEPISVSHPRQLVPGLSTQLNRFIEQCTALELEDRFASTQELSMAFNELKRQPVP